MSRKQYRALAAGFAELMRANQDRTAQGVIAACARQIADILATDNGSFDRATFYLACGLNSTGFVPVDSTR